MKEYPKILGSHDNVPWGEECIAFYKFDGSNLRFEWNPKRGWYKFGTRRHLFDRSCPEYGQAIGIFMEKYSEPVEKLIRDNFPKIESAIVYGEFFGHYSFSKYQNTQDLKSAGLIPEGCDNEKKDVVLFDLNLHKKGFVSPFNFIDLFSHLHIPQAVYQGKLTSDFCDAVRQDKLIYNAPQSIVEGVVCKGGEGHQLWMRKIKSFSYLNKLKEVFGVGWEDHWE